MSLIGVKYVAVQSICTPLLCLRNLAYFRPSDTLSPIMIIFDGYNCHRTCKQLAIIHMNYRGHENTLGTQLYVKESLT